MNILIIAGEYWPHWSLYKIFDNNYCTKYFIFYKGIFSKEKKNHKVNLLDEKSKSFFLWPFKILIRTYKLLKEIKNFKPKYIICHHDDAIISVLPTLIIFKLLKINIKFIAYMHAGVKNYEVKNLINIINKFCIKYFYRFFDKIITVSKGNRRMLKKEFGLKNIKVIYNPLDIEDIMKKTKEKKIVKRDKQFVFLTIGRLTEQKGQWFLIRAFYNVCKKNSNAYLLIIGEGELNKKLKNLVSNLNINKNVKFLGLQKNVFPFIKYSDCFILTSLWESFGQVLIEALALNKLIISTDCVSGPREIISPNLKINEKINYPYDGKYGILIEPFKNIITFDNLKAIPLDDKEKCLSDLMIKIMKKRSNKKTIYQALNFDINAIEKKIKNIIR